MQNAMILPTAGTVAKWARDAVNEMNKVCGIADANFKEAGGNQQHIHRC
jgi:hypothetical protein